MSLLLALAESSRSSIKVSVMSIDALLRITELALKQFTSTMCDNRDYPWGPNKGRPPLKGYVEQRQFSRELWTNDLPIAAWEIENCEITRKIDPLPKFPRPVIDGLFYDSLIGSWGVTDDMRKLSINWQAGPRFGCGFMYPILEAPTGTLYLGDRKQTWVS